MITKRILVALSGTPFTPTAVRYATELARANDAAITGVTIVDQALSDGGSEPVGGGARKAAAIASQRLAITQERIEQEIASFETACRVAEVQYVVDRETGEPLDLLCSLARYHDLVVIGLRGLFEYGVVRNPDDAVSRLVARGVRPILAVSEVHRPVRRALVAYDGSVEAAKAMKHFVQGRLWPNATIEIACAPLDGLDTATLVADAAEYCRSHGFEATTHLLTGKAGDALLARAEETGADVVVAGSTRRSRIAQFILGDTALKLLRDADVPVFISA